MKKKILYIAGGALVLAILAGAAAWAYLGSSPMEAGQLHLYHVRPGSGFYEVAEDLSRAGVIRSIRFFKLLGNIRNVSYRIKAGFYHLDSGMSAGAILDALVAGKVHSVRVTVPEGRDNRSVARIMAAAGLTTEEEFLAAAGNAEALRSYGLGSALPAAKSTEGFLFPDTYMIPWGSSARDIVNMMLANFRRQVGTELLGQMERSSTGLFRTVILASIVEREARSPAERPSIAGVFANRIRIGMKLESCATIQYILGEVRPVILFSDLRRESPYNTYLHAGYPVGPIANPGLASIRAAADPEKHDYLYFVSRNDGTHVFSKTLADHNRAARIYQWN
jgi:UPF0755 protein